MSVCGHNQPPAPADKDIEAYQNKHEEKQNKDCRFWRKWCRHGCPFWCKKYFWEGQLKRGAQDEGLELVVKTGGPCSHLSHTQRKLVGWLLPAVLFNIAYWAIIIHRNMIYVFKEKYPMTITMIFGSIIAGMTSVGGGAIAFPVMSLVLKEPAAIGRDLALTVQSIGLSSASFAIFFMHVHIEKHALLFSLAGSAVGVVFGLELVDPNLTSPMKKMGFSTIFFGFAFALFLVNWKRKRTTVNNIVNLNWWKRCVLLFTGFCGGIFTSFAGSGADICMFSVLTLLFKVSEKVATPTSVILMAMTSLVGWFWRSLVTQTMPLTSYEYILVCVPVIVVGAPFGSLVGTHFHRLVLASCVYIIVTAALIGAFCIVPQTPALAGGSVGVIIFMCLLYYALSVIGNKLHKSSLKENLRIKSMITKEANVENKSHENGTWKNVLHSGNIPCEIGGLDNPGLSNGSTESTHI